MGSGLLVARLVLAIVFVVAGVTKLLDRAGTRRAMSDFGLPSALAPAVALLLPVVELAIAIALIPRATAWWGGVGALVVLLAFIVAIAVNLVRGRRPDCHCFGQIYSEPVGWPTVVRNSLLAAIAAFIVIGGRDDPGLGVVSWARGLGGTEALTLGLGVVVLTALLLMGMLLINLLRQNGRLLVRMEALEELVTGAAGVEPASSEAAPVEGVAGLPVGSPAPSFGLSGLRGETLTLDFLRALGKPVMLVFSRPGCVPCETLLPELRRWQDEHSAELTIAMVSEGTVEANRVKFADEGMTHVVVQQGREVAEAYRADGTPAALVVQPDGTVGSSLALGPDQIRNLVSRTVGTPTLLPMAAPTPTDHNGAGNGAAPALPTGSERIGLPAPAVNLADLGGKTVNLSSSYRGRETLVLFWNPDCGFCSQMLDELKAWESSRPKGTPEIVVISTGDAEVNKAMGLRSRVLLDNEFSTGASFGANGTPMAVLVDKRGRIASELAAGGQAVIALARGQQPVGT